MFRILLLIYLSFLGFACTNYTSTSSVQAPPLLVFATNNGNSNFTVKVRASNPELIFQGYRLYSGISEKAARNQADLNVGTDCTRAAGTLTVLPVQPREFTFEIDPANTPPGTGIDCRFRVALASGLYISIRSIGLSIQVQVGSSGLKVSGPSNAIILP